MGTIVDTSKIAITQFNNILTMEAKSKLSKGVLGMKFMKRSALREVKEDSEESQKIIDDTHWVLDLPQLTEKVSLWQHEPSYASLEELKFGRMSFKGFNAEIEKVMKLRNTKLELDVAEAREKETSVSDREMAERYESIVGTIANKFKKKRERNVETDGPSSSDYVPQTKKDRKDDDDTLSKVKKFLKPPDN